MCGIAGIISQHNQADTQLLASAVSCLQHRGPQGEGIWTNTAASVALGHRRLSIIDLSDAASQPMHYAGRYTIVYNGELYNYIELRSELGNKGYTFSTASDTEVLLAAYAEWKEDCLLHFDGMFAFAIWDEQQQQFFAARDRMGEKPFYYSLQNGAFYFASELKALWTMQVPQQVNLFMLYNFLTISYTGNPSDPAETFYEDVFQLPPASYLVHNAKTLDTRVSRYWQVYIDQALTSNKQLVIEQFDQLFTASVAKRLRSDVQIGTSLSGGLDSSSIVALCHAFPAGSYGHQCFTIGFEGFEKDETANAKQVAKKFGLTHHLVEITDQDVPLVMQKVAAAQEIPFTSASVLAQYKVYEAAKNSGVTVLLDGQGADELLGGYHHYYRWYWQELYRNKRLRSSGEQLAAVNLGVKEKFGWKEKLAALMPDFTGSLYTRQKEKSAARIPDLQPEFTDHHKKHFYHTLPVHFTLNGVLHHNSFVHGLEELLRLADRNSMAHGVEVRLPFLQHELVQFLFTLPPEYKIHKGWTKWILRKAMEKRLPEEIVWRKDKTGFEPPQKRWMENKDVSEMIMEGKKQLVAQKILRPEVLKKNRPHSSYAAGGMDWKYWSASQLFKG